MTSPAPDAQFEALLEYVKRSRGFDFTGYKRTSLVRRVNKRMQEVRIETYSEYVDFLEVHPDEFMHLFNTLLINVTSFFRDRPAWDFLIQEVLPQIVARKPPNAVIRIWSAGCASGEEAYSLAMALAEVIGLDRFPDRVKIYAVDIDEEALAHARQASYQEHEVEGISPEMRSRYLEMSEGRYVIHKDLRRAVIFGRLNLIQDAPISSVDLLVCRNTLMYFNAETQVKILARFHFALQDQGFLFLGKAEMLLSYANCFTPVILKHRIFTKVRKENWRDQPLVFTNSTGSPAANTLTDKTRLRDAAFDSSPLPQIVVDSNGCLAFANASARELFKINQRDVGRPLQDLEVSYRPVELRSTIQQAYAENRVISIRHVAWRPTPGETVFVDVQVAPIANQSNIALGAAITFTDITRYKRLQEELEQSNNELEMAYEELQSTNEELETTNEELQSSNEELETTNEELQATNEELETMNEELQSTNEELHTVNDELQRRSEDLNQSNAFLEAILSSLRGGVVVVNRSFQVQVWNYRSEDLWGLRASEALGQNFLSLDIGLPVEQLQSTVRNCLTGNSVEPTRLTLPAINRRGKTMQCQVTCTPLCNLDAEIQGVILIMEEYDRASV